MYSTQEHPNTSKKKILGDFKKDIESNTIIVEDFNTPLSKMDRFYKRKSTKILRH